jgi:hypothetical protein
MYDYVIIGGGPTGLTLAWGLAQYGKKVLIIERENSLGGCHRVQRVNGMFTEHGPRIYVGNNNTFKFLLTDMGLSFNNLFTKYEFNGKSIATQVIKRLTIKEMFDVMCTYLYYIIDSSYSKNISVEDFMIAHNFSQSAKEYFDKICRITDGAGMNNYTLYEFLEIINQNIYYNIHQPRVPNDVGLFKKWEIALRNTGNVDIMLNTEIDYIESIKKNLVTKIFMVGDSKQIKSKNYIFAIPPKALAKILIKSPSTYNAFGDLTNYIKWQQNTEYLLFIPIVFHWDTKLDIEKLWGVPASDWGIGSIVLSNYTDFNDMRSKTVITTSITMPDKKSSYLNKTPHECNKHELINEVFRQLKSIYSKTDFKTFTTAFISPEMYRKNNRWYSKDSAYVRTVDGFKNYQSLEFNNLYSVGTHNGNSFYNFTSIESAVSNGITLLNALVPESRKKYKIISFITVNQTIAFFIIILILYFVYKKY